jgi:Flp pilus assembly pilin Flp
MKALVNFVNDDRGVDLIEYALLAGLVGVAAVGFLGTFKTSVDQLYGRVTTKVNAVAVP